MTNETKAAPKNALGRALSRWAQVELRERIASQGLIKAAESVGRSEYTTAKGAAGANVSRAAAEIIEFRLNAKRPPT